MSDAVSMKRTHHMARSSVEDLFRTRVADYGKAMVKKDKKEKTRIINDLTHDTGYNRKYVIHKLSKIVFTYTAKNFRGGNITKARVRTASKAGSSGCHRGRPSEYRPLQEPLERIWEYFDRISPQRLIKLIKDNITEIAGYKYFRIDEHCKELLMSVSSATVSRLLRPAREKHKIRGVSTTTSPGDSLNKLIDVRVYYSFEDREYAGTFQVDTVCHCGSGEPANCLWTLTLTDIATGFTFIRVLRQKTQRCVLEALEDIWNEKPYPILELHIDNGGELKNYGFLQWCNRHGLRVTRSRSYHKNDNSFVENKNYSVVRACVGYFRYEQNAYSVMEDLYWDWQWLVNLYYPSVKLLSKERIGARTYKTYDEPLTPYERVMNDTLVPQEDKECFKAMKDSLSLIKLKDEEKRFQEKLLSLACKDGCIRR